MLVADSVTLMSRPHTSSGSHYQMSWLRYILHAVLRLAAGELVARLGSFALLGYISRHYGVDFLGAYALARTSGLLGFTESGWSTEAVISKTAEIVAILALGGHLVTRASASRGAEARTP